MKPWVVKQSKTLFRNPYIQVCEDHVLLPGGHEIPSFCHLRLPDWANIFALTRDQHVLMVRQYRHGIADLSLEIPAGMVEEHESPVHAVLRELREETGYASDQEPILMRSMLTNPAMSDNYVHSFLLLDCFRHGEQDLDPTESIEVVTIPYRKFQQAIDLGDITQHFSITAYYLAKYYLEEMDEF